MAPPRPDSDFHDLSLVQEVRRALTSPGPLELLRLASGLASFADDTLDSRSSPFTHARDTRDTSPSQEIHDFAALLLDTEAAETDALLRAWAPMLGDELLAQRITAALKTRTHPGPDWLTRIDELVPRRAISMLHILRHIETIVVEVSTATEPFCLAITIDRSGMPYLEDVDPLEQSIDDLLESVRTDHASDHMDVADIPLADARARLEEAIDMADHIHPPIETDTWPDLGRLVAWIVRLMPADGHGFDLHEWEPEELDHLADDFMGSPWAADLIPTDRWHARLLFGFQADYGSNDPLRWSDDFVARVMYDLYPRKVIDSDEHMLRLPVVLRALVQYANERSGIPHMHTVDALQTIDDCEPEYRSAVLDDPDELDGPLESVGDMFRHLLGNMGDIMTDWAHFTLHDLAVAVGGTDALEELDLTPLPAEEFDTTGIDPDILLRMESLAAQVTTTCTEFFDDPEMTTSAQRILTRIATANPAAFRRRFTDPPTVAALCWITGKVNDAFTTRSPQQVTVRGLMEHLGLKGSPNQRAWSLLRNVIPTDEVRFDAGVALGDPALLTSTRRREIAQMRDDANRQLALEEDDEP